MSPPTELIEDVTAEIFLRLPPDEPEHLFRASLVCKPWMRLLTDADFLRRYRAFHRTPPLLGCIQRRRVMQGTPPHSHHGGTPHRHPRLPPGLDCRHGRVLLQVDGDGGSLLVWDPVTGDHQRVREIDIDVIIYIAAVLCSVSGCDHLDCLGSPFRVVLLATDENGLIKTSVYSSETGAWSAPVSLAESCLPPRVGIELVLSPYIQPRRVALIRDELYFSLRRPNTIIKYYLGQKCLSVIKPASCNAHFFALMEMEDFVLGFSYIIGWNFYLWSRKGSSEGIAEWVQSRAIELKGIIPIAGPDDGAIVVGSAEDVGVIFVSTDAGLFSFELKSGRARNVHEPEDYFSFLPYMSFYTPGRASLSLLAYTQFAT